MAYRAAVPDGENRGKLDGAGDRNAMAHEVDASEYAMELAVHQPPPDRSTAHAAAVQLGDGDQAQLAFRNPSDDQVAGAPTMYKARNHVQPNEFGDISTREMLMSPGRGSARRFRALYMGIGGHRPPRMRLRSPNGAKPPD
jgi:hypothetical protein